MNLAERVAVDGFFRLPPDSTFPTIPGVWNPHPFTVFHYHQDPEHGAEHGAEVARPTNRLSVKGVAATTKAGYHADGGGLYLLVGPTGNRSWVMRYQRQGKRREMGLGAVGAVSLAQARDRAAEARTLLAHGHDPLEARNASRAPGMTFGDCADAYILAHQGAWKNDEQANQWTQSLKDYGPPRDMRVAEVDTEAVVGCLTPIWGSKTETASRTRARIERVLDWARVSGYRNGDNPARWRGHLDKLLPKPSKVTKVQHHRAMPYADAPAFMARLKEREARSRLALRFTILTAARTEETVGSSWGEFDLDAGLWNVPAERMKGGRPHVVPLPAAAVTLLRGLDRKEPPFALSENTMLYLVQKPTPKGYGLPFTVHGFRSTFRDWAADTTDFPGEVVEMALAHTVRNKVEAAYRRGKLLDKRRQLMEAWSAYLGA